MKVSLFLSSLWLFLASLFSSSENAVLTGTVKDQRGEALIGVTVMVQKDRAHIKGAITDVDGKYRIEVEPGLYEVEFSYTGFASKRIPEVKVENGKENILDVQLESGSLLEEVVVTGRASKKESRARGLGAAPASPGAKVTDTRSKSITPERRGTVIEESKPVPMPTKKLEVPADFEGGEVSIKSKKSDGLGYYIDGIRVSETVAPLPEPDAEIVEIAGMAKKAPADKDDLVLDLEDGKISDEEVASGTPAQPAPRAGLLTAGEWNDLHNWNHHWLDMLADGEIEVYQKMYGFYPRQRYTVMLSNENDFPIADAVVTLKRSGHVLWEARTDNTGKAELWASMFTAEKENGELKAEIKYEDRNHEIAQLKPAAEGFNYLKINAACKSPNKVDIVWAVDATGSMGDEIEYLKTELLDVIARAKSRNTALEYRMGTVFYRDKGDDYITKSSALTPEIAKTVEFIQKQYAGGGGDYPEAVHSALEEAIYGQKWSENAIARICFLVLDASPHQGDAINASLEKSIREAARKGIRIVPIAASGVQKDTEFLMKFFGLATNGSYVFLTDHSGIGGKHLEPTTDEYKVEPLNQLLVRLITEYTSIESCEGKSEIRFETDPSVDPQQQQAQVLQALYYPNPAVDQFTLELPFEVQSVTLYNAEGQAVKKLEKPVAGVNLILINDLPAGFYTIRILSHGMMQSGKLMVVRS